MKSGIYLILSPSMNGYIGSTKDFSRRKTGHFYDLKYNKHVNGGLQNAWNKYEGKLKFVIIERCSVEFLIEREQFWMDNHSILCLRLYNAMLTAGRFEFTDEIRAKMSASARSKPPVTDETRARLAAAGTGRKLLPHHIEILKNRVTSQEQRDAISRAHKGRIVSAETRELLSNIGKGRKASDETRAKLSKSRMGMRPTPETLAKLKGRKMSEETKAKMRKPKSAAHAAAISAGKKGVLFGPVTDPIVLERKRAAMLKAQTARAAAHDHMAKLEWIITGIAPPCQ